MPRHCDYTDSLADDICARIAAGDSLRTICQAKDKPHKDTVLRWLAANDGFAVKYARAREAQAEFHHDEMDRIEAGVLDATIPAQAGNVVLTNKRWRMEKLKPKVYGAAMTLKGDKENPLRIVAQDLTDEELLAKAAGHG